MDRDQPPPEMRLPLPTSSFVPPPMPLLQFKFPSEMMAAKRDAILETEKHLPHGKQLPLETGLPLGTEMPPETELPRGNSQPEVMRRCGDSGQFSAASLLSLPLNREMGNQDESLFLETDFGVPERVSLCVSV